MDELNEYRHMWDGSEEDWKLIQYDSSVFLVEFNFNESGPNRREFQSVVEFIGLLPNENETEAWERLRECSGIGKAAPLGPSRMKLLRQHESENDLNLTVLCIEPIDHLVLTPNGLHYNWLTRPELRSPVVAKMLESGVDVVQEHLD